MERGRYHCFKNRVAVVSGAAQGIGEAIVAQLEKQGAIVAKLDIQFEPGQSPLCFKVDIASHEQIQKALSQIERELGPIDYLVNAAGILRLGSALEQGTRDWLDTFAVNTHGAFYLCQSVARYMVQRKRGAIVNVGSNASRVPRMNMAAYAASKAASEHMLRCLGLEVAEFNVRCNSVCPGSTYTAMQQQCWHNPDDERSVIAGVPQKFRLGIPLGRIAQPDDIAHSVLFLLSDHAQHITLESLTVDAGATLGC